MTFVVMPMLMLLGIAIISVLYKQQRSSLSRHRLPIQDNVADVLCTASQQFLGLISANCQMHRQTLRRQQAPGA